MTHETKEIELTAMCEYNSFCHDKVRSMNDISRLKKTFSASDPTPFFYKDHILLEMNLF